MRSSVAASSVDVLRAELRRELLHRARPDDRRRSPPGWLITHATARCTSEIPASSATFASASAASSLRWFSGLRQVPAVGDESTRAGSSGPCRGATSRRASRRRAGSTGSRPCRTGRTSAARRPRCRARGSSTAAARTRTAHGRAARPSTAPRRSRRPGTSSCRGSAPCPVHEVGERAQRVVDVARRVGPVDLVQVDVVGAEPAQAVLALADDPTARVARQVRVLAHRAVHLRREHDVVAATGERLARRSPRTHRPSTRRRCRRS